MKIDEMVATYIELRDRRTAINEATKKKVAALTEVMDKIEARILAHLNENGTEAAKCAVGTAFKHKRTSATVADWDASLEFIKEHELWHMLERRVNKTAVDEFVASTGDLPPGINYNTEVTVQIRRN